MTLDLMTVGHDSPHGVQLEPRACTHCGSLSASYPSFGFRCCIERDGMSLLRFFTRVTCDIIFRTWFLSPIILFFAGYGGRHTQGHYTLAWALSLCSQSGTLQSCLPFMALLDDTGEGQKLAAHSIRSPSSFSTGKMKDDKAKVRT